MRVVRVDEWAEFDEMMSPGGSFQSWAFRGQRDDSWQLVSSLARHLGQFHVRSEEWPNQEARTLRIFKRKAHLHLDHVPADEDDFQWLALIQHYGGPTRLLDFTWSPYVAAFFALEVAMGDCAVFALDTSAIARSVFVPLRNADVFHDSFLPGTEDHIYQGEPGVMNGRLVAQLGTFIVPGRIDQPLDELVERVCGPDALCKIVLDQGMRDSALRALYDRNVHYASLFPDLNGLAMSLRLELENHWAFDPKTGVNLPAFAANPYARSTNTSINE